MSVSGQVTLLGGHDDLVVLGDKGYMSAPLAQALRAEHALHLLTPPRRNARTPALQGRISLWNGLRLVIETVNEQLTAQFGTGKHEAHTFAGLAAQLEAKLTAHTLCLALNWRWARRRGCRSRPSPSPSRTRLSLYVCHGCHLYAASWQHYSEREYFGRSERRRSMNPVFNRQRAVIPANI